jgi:hypothetical protein
VSIYRNVEFIDAGGRPLSGIGYSIGREVTIKVSEPGLEWTATLKPEDWTEKRTNCFCCSRGDRDGSDPACRNHGFAAKRPCEAHGMPGSTWEELDGSDSGEMPASVQAARAGDMS